MRGALLTSLAVLAVAAPACARRDPGAAPGVTRVVLRFGPLGPDPAPFRAIVDGFERAHPGVRVAIEPVPNDGDLAHQLLVTALGAGAEDLDVFAIDVVWVPELARAGWLADLSDAFPPARVRAEFLAGPADAVVRDGRTRAVPWFVDVGLLYYRRDLVPEPPRTYAALERDARAVMARTPGIAGFVWQGRQYEGLSCNFFESLWGHGGGAEAAPDRLPLDDAAAPEALRWLRHLVREGVSPASVLVAAEEDARRLFGTGGAVFMRNWPYAWPLLQDRRSPVRGRVGVAPLPSADGAPAPGVLGGWQLAVSARSPPARRAAAIALIAHLTSPEANLALARAYGRNPARRATYDDPRLRAADPFIAGLLPHLERARPRPLSPYYMLAADAVQGELSAAVAGLRSPAEALRRAETQVAGIRGDLP